MILRFFIYLLPRALNAVDAGSRNWKDVLSALIAYPLDIYICRFYWEPLVGPRQENEKTISDMLERLAGQGNIYNKDYWLYVEIARKINRISPTKNHIKSVL